MRPRNKALLARSAGSAALWAAALVLGGCSSTPKDNAPTLKSLDSKTVELPPDKGVPADDSATMAAYRDYLKKAPQDKQRPEAMRRLGDLEMESADVGASGATPAAGAAPGGTPVPSAPSAAPGTSAVSPQVAGAASVVPPTLEKPKPEDVQGYQRAVNLYSELLKAYPNAPDNDRVLYQLAHAYESGGDLEKALATLDLLVRQYPKSGLMDEAQFRRGELEFAMRNYAGAEQAYATILNGKGHSQYFERAMYMHGWSLYKQGRLEDSLQSFFGVLDLKLIAREGEVSLDKVEGLTRADRELVEDTLRVTSLCLENLQGADSIPPYMTSNLRRDYEFRVYQQLGELYLAQERIKDAADTFSAFARRYPLHSQAPVLQARVIEIYQGAGFATLVLEAKQEYVERYGIHSEFRKVKPAAWERTQARVKEYLAELTRHFHALAQKSKKHEDYLAAAHWYREYLEAFPADPQSAQMNFLLAELLFEDKSYADAAVEYEKAAYHYLPHPKSADAGYAALLSYAEVEKGTPPGDRAGIEKTEIESALRFGYAFPKDPRTGPVLSNAADKLYAAHDNEKAIEVAQMVLKLDPPAPPANRLVALKVVAHASFDSGRFDQSEQGFTGILALLAPNDPARGEMTEQLAASVYKQGEQARNAGRMREAVDDFDRVAKVAPDSPVRASAQFDAAAILIGLKDWPAAARTLEDFRQRYPKNPLQSQVNDKLAVVYMESGQSALAAGEFERMAARKDDPQMARSALWQSAELYEKAKDRADAARIYERYVQEYPAPLEPSIEARARLVRMAQEDGNKSRVLSLQREILQADQAGGAARTDRTKYLAATASLALAEPVYEDFHKVALVEPLQKQLKLKKARMEDLLKAYGVAASYGVADVATAATYRTAEAYHEFGDALMQSERPKKLSKDELEQYDLMLEEQADPFVEKAVTLHEANARHAADGIYDQWVQDSYSALAKLRPLRYGKTEHSEDAIDAIR